MTKTPSYLKMIKTLVKAMHGIDTVDGYRKHVVELERLVDKAIEEEKERAQ